MKTTNLIPKELLMDIAPNREYRLIRKIKDRVKIVNDRGIVSEYDLKYFMNECTIEFDDMILARYFGDKETKPIFDEEDLKAIRDRKSKLFNGINRKEEM